MSKDSEHVQFIKAVLRAERRHDDRMDVLYSAASERHKTAPLDPDYDPALEFGADEVSAMAGCEVGEREAVFVQYAQPGEFVEAITSRLTFVEDIAGYIKKYLAALPVEEASLVTDHVIEGIAEVSRKMFEKADEIIRYGTVQEFGPKESDRETN